MDTQVDPRHTRAALSAAAEFAGISPSIHNTQPWRWRLVDSTLELRAVRQRQLGMTDPDAHMLLLSCGAALYHAVTALAAEGWRSQVLRIPDHGDDDVLATITVLDRAHASTEAMRAVQVLRVRHTDRRPVSDVPAPPRAIEAIAAAAATAGASLHVLRPDQVIELASAADRAQEIELADPEWRDELSYWAGGARVDGIGIPGSAIPEVPTATTVPSRDFGRSGQLRVTAGHDGAAAYGFLFGQDNSPGGWLRAGEALCAAWVAAIEHGLSVLPMSAAVELPLTRQSLRHILANVAEPYLALRLGIPDPDEPSPGHTPRLPVEQILEIVS